MSGKDTPDIQEVLEFAGPRVVEWYAAETERRKAERQAAEATPKEYHGATLEPGRLYNLTLRHSRKLNMLYLGWFAEAGYGRGGPLFVRIAEDGPSGRVYHPWSGDVESVSRVHETSDAQKAHAAAYMAKAAR